ncbi:MAG: NCS2 family permease [Peptoniphilaceae bacterium]|nr:NCS2 family permease [Peptoniphilaceae bacterium]MDY6085419.1 NCS2 family permease [Peptoniphilaceae bacterium]
MEQFFHLKEHGTTVSTELMAGITTFFAMSYILFVNPSILSLAGMPWGGVYLATIIAAIVGTLIMALFANVPYAVAPGMGMNAFFTYTVVMQLGFTWQQALAMVFVCGLINVLITVTKIRKLLIESIPDSLQKAIGGGIGIFISYIGLKNAGLLQFTFDPGTYTMAGETVIGSSAAVPGLVSLTSAGVILALIGLALTVVLVVKNVKGAILLGIVGTTLIGIPMGIVDLGAFGASAVSVNEAFSELGATFMAAFGPEGLGSLFNDPGKLPLLFVTIFAFSITDTFDTIGTFIGTGQRAGIFTAEEVQKMEHEAGFSTRLDKALFADSVATSIGAVFGTSNTTTFVESAAGIGSGARTGLASVFTAAMFALSILVTPIASIVPAQATSAALIIVGVMMLTSFTDIHWGDLEEAIPAFFASIFMGLTYSVSNGIAFGFFAYIIVKIVRGKAQDVKPLIWICSLLFILNLVLIAQF